LYVHWMHVFPALIPDRHRDGRGTSLACDSLWHAVV